MSPSHIQFGSKCSCKKSEEGVGGSPTAVNPVKTEGITAGAGYCNMINNPALLSKLFMTYKTEQGFTVPRAEWSGFGLWQKRWVTKAILTFQMLLVQNLGNIPLDRCQVVFLCL